MVIQKSRKKSGMLTLISFIIVMAIFSLALLIFHNSQKTEIIFTESAIADRVLDLFSSTESSLREIFNYYFPVKVFATLNEDETTNITFRENISREKGNWGKEFNTKIEDFINYVETKEPLIKISNELLEDKELILTIFPHNIEYSRTWGTGNVRIKVIPKTEQENFDTYEVFVNTHDVEIDKMTEQLRAAGDFKFKITAFDNYGHEITEEKMVDPESLHQVQVFLVGGNKVKITLNNRELETWTNLPEEVTITTTINGLEKTEEAITIKYGKSSIFVDFSEFNITKNSTVSLSLL